MLSLEIIVALGSVLALLTGTLVYTQLQRSKLPEVRREGRGARA